MRNIIQYHNNQNQKKSWYQIQTPQSASNHQYNIMTNINSDQERSKIFANNEQNGYSRNLYGIS
jgi:hypothetical protein